MRVHERYALTDDFLAAAAANGGSTAGAGGDFHAEGCCSQRRYEYMLPLRLLLPPAQTGPDGTSVHAALPAERIVRIKTHPATQSKTHKENSYSMDQEFPLETEEGQIRVAFFRKLKNVLKQVAGRRSYHNYVTGIASPEDAVAVRRIDKIYHKELVMLHGEPWAIFSVTGDSLLRGQVGTYVRTCVRM